MFRSAFILALVLIPFVVRAESPAIYKIEKNGSIEYTSKPGTRGAKAASLPKIGRWKIETPKVSGVTCDAHGGINCALGEDADGSVLCFDNFKDSTMRFQFECTAAKLEVVQISEPRQNGSFTVTLRNSKSVPAKKSAVVFKPQRLQPGSNLFGPEQIEGYGSADFEYRPEKKFTFAMKPKVSQIVVSWDNCG